MRLTVEDFLAKLAHGQLKNTAATDDSQEGLILPEYEEQMINLLNQGLVDLTTRKKLFEEIVSLDFVDSQNIYSLDTSETGDFKNLVRVLSVTTSDERVHVPKTNAHITQPNPESLRFSKQFMDHHKPSVDILFQTLHPTVELMDEMNLPAHLYEALVLYVSGLYLSHIGGDENNQKGDSYYGLYLKKLNDDIIENSSGTSELVDEDTRFTDRGFV